MLICLPILRYDQSVFKIFDCSVQKFWKACSSQSLDSRYCARSWFDHSVLLPENGVSQGVKNSSHINKCDHEVDHNQWWWVGEEWPCIVDGHWPALPQVGHDKQQHDLGAVVVLVLQRASSSACSSCCRTSYFHPHENVTGDILLPWKCWRFDQSNARICCHNKRNIWKSKVCSYIKAHQIIPFCSNSDMWARKGLSLFFLTIPNCFSYKG